MGKIIRAGDLFKEEEKDKKTLKVGDLLKGEKQDEGVENLLSTKPPATPQEATKRLIEVDVNKFNERVKTAQEKTKRLIEPVINTLKELDPFSEENKAAFKALSLPPEALDQMPSDYQEKAAEYIINKYANVWDWLVFDSAVRLAGMGAVKLIKAYPHIKDYISNVVRKYKIKERGLTTLTDDQLLDIYKNAPDELKKEMATYNPRIREILSKEPGVSKVSGGETIRPKETDTRTFITPEIKKETPTELVEEPKQVITPEEIIKEPVEETKPVITPEEVIKEPVVEETKPETTPEESITKETTLPEETAKVKKISPKELELLAEEARKYKSAEEFIKAQQEIPNFDEMITYRTDFENKLGLDRSLSAYGAIVKPENVYKAAEGFTARQLKGLSNWYGIRLKTHNNPAMAFVKALLDIDIIPKKQLSEEQLKQIYNLATKGAKEVKPEVPPETQPAIPKELEPLAEEMRKYPTYEEFIKVFFRTDIPEYLSDKAVEILDKIPTKALLGRDIGREILPPEKLNKIFLKFGSLEDFYNLATKGQTNKLNQITEEVAPKESEIEEPIKTEGEETKVLKEEAEKTPDGKLKAPSEYFAVFKKPNGEKELVPIRKYTPFSYKGIDFAVYKLKDEKSWKVIEKRTGLLIDEGKTKEKAIENAKKQIDGRDIEKIKRIIEEQSKDIIPFEKESKKVVSKDEVISDSFDTKTKKVKRIKGTEAAVSSANLDKDISKFQPITNDSEFKLWKASEDIIMKYARRFKEGGYIPPNAIGVFYSDTKNIFLQSANNLYVVIHEVTHFLDDKYKWMDRFIKVIGTTSRGTPIYDPSTAEIRKALTDFYLLTYPGAKKTHPLRTRISEGRAMLIQKAVEQPELLEKDEFKILVNEILTPGGKYYLKEYTELIEDGRKLINEYKKLDPTSRIISRIADTNRAEVTKTFFTTKDDIIEYFIDKSHYIGKLSKIAGKQFTPEDPYTMAMSLRYITSLVNSNCTPGKGIKAFIGSEYKQLSDVNFGDLFEEAKKYGGQAFISRFDAWLIARRVRNGYIRLGEMREKIIQDTEGKIDPETATLQDLNKYLEELKKKYGLAAKEQIDNFTKEFRAYKEIKRVITRDNITRELAEASYQDGLNDKNILKLAEIHDKIAKANLEILNDMGKLSPELYEKFMEDNSYASFRRDIFTLHTEEEYPEYLKKGSESVGLSMLKRRKGSELPFAGPTYSLLIDHYSLIKNAIKQKTINRIYDIVNKQPELFGDLFQPVPLKVSIDDEGRVIYPQLQDPEILMAWEAGKPKPLQILDIKFKKVLEMAFTTSSDSEGIIKAMHKATQLFSRGTTSLNWRFILRNVFRDLTHAVAMTKTNLSVIDPFIKFSKLTLNKIKGDESEESRFAREYIEIGGHLQTIYSWVYEYENPKELYRKAMGDLTLVERLYNKADKLVDALAMPAEYSEMFSRMTEYINARKKGYDVLSSLEFAGRVAAPLHHIGYWGGRTGQSLFRTIAFANPQIQYFYQAFFEGVFSKDPKVRKRALLVMAALAAVKIGSLYPIKKASEEQKRTYRNISNYDRMNYIFFPLPGRENRENGVLGRIPISTEFGYAAGLINSIIDYHMLDTKYSGDDVIDLASSPLPNLLDISSPARLVFSWIPQIFVPFVGIATDTKTFPKVQPLTPPNLKSLPKEEQYTFSTSDLAINFAKSPIGKSIGLSPIQIEFILEEFMGSFADLLMMKTRGAMFKNPFVVKTFDNAFRGFEFYYNLRNQIEGIRKAMKETYTQKGEIRQLTPKEEVILSLEGRVKDLDKALNSFKILWNKKGRDFRDPELLSRRKEILDKLDALWTDYDKNINWR